MSCTRLLCQLQTLHDFPWLSRHTRLSWTCDRVSQGPDKRLVIVPDVRRFVQDLTNYKHGPCVTACRSWAQTRIESVHRHNTAQACFWRHKEARRQAPHQDAKPWAWACSSMPAAACSRGAESCRRTGAFKRRQHDGGARHGVRQHQGKHRCCLPIVTCNSIEQRQMTLPPTVLTVSPLVDVQGQQVQAPTQVVKDTTSL